MRNNRSSIPAGQGKPSLVPNRTDGSEDPKRGTLGRIKVKRTEARTAKQRSEDRIRDLVQHSTIRFRGIEYAVSVINVSSRGTMIESGIAPWIGEGVEIRFSADQWTLCRVRWIRDDRIGLEFADETIVWDCSQPHRAAYDRRGSGDFGDEAGADPERRRAERGDRHDLVRDGRLDWSGMSIPVRIRNISEHGAAVEAERSLWPGAEVELQLGEAGWQMAEIRWVEGRQLGLHFYEPIDLDQLALPGDAEADDPAEG